MYINNSVLNNEKSNYLTSQLFIFNKIFFVSDFILVMNINYKINIIIELTFHH